MEKKTVNCFESISVIVPVVTETKAFIETVETVIDVCGTDLKEIIICPAHFASPECKRIAGELFEKYCDVPIIIFMQTGTFDDALKDIFNIVSASHFMIQPSDLEEDPKMLNVFIEESKKHPDAIITGSRFLSKECSANYPKTRKLIFAVFRKVFQMTYSKKLTDTTFSYRTIPSEKVKNLVLKGKSYSILYEAFLKILRTGVEVIEVPVIFQKHPEATSNTSFLKDGIRYLTVFFRVRFSDPKTFYIETPPANMK